MDPLCHATSFEALLLIGLGFVLGFMAAVVHSRPDE